MPLMPNSRLGLDRPNPIKSVTHPALSSRGLNDLYPDHGHGHPDPDGGFASFERYALIYQDIRFFACRSVSLDGRMIRLCVNREL